MLTNSDLAIIIMFVAFYQCLNELKYYRKKVLFKQTIAGRFIASLKGLIIGIVVVFFAKLIYKFLGYFFLEYILLILFACYVFIVSIIKIRKEEIE